MAGYQVGDKVTVHGEITSVGFVHGPIVKLGCNPKPEYSAICVHESWIATHTPKPREFKPGDAVHATASKGLGEMRIVAIDDDAAWLKDSDDIRWTFAVDKLRHADEAD